ncbi:hypothetical protein NDU88_001892 [Pleurodeles waltl]|uniref:Uncharacterized protein n=1 Tax=Pleurodeles waltl TaxID=8319 RepID=A0AAV7KT42_PLEWA|nr:hypothetical protein NDU88_001892 [Pleurodeles waltl]
MEGPTVWQGPGLCGAITSPYGDQWPVGPALGTAGTGDWGLRRSPQTQRLTAGKPRSINDRHRLEPQSKREGGAGWRCGLMAQRPALGPWDVMGDIVLPDTQGRGRIGDSAPQTDKPEPQK